MKIEKEFSLDRKIKKLINEYESQIKDCDKILDINIKQIRQLRSGKELNVTTDELRTERFTVDAKRQAYVQFIVNLKDLKE